MSQFSSPSDQFTPVTFDIEEFDESFYIDENNPFLMDEQIDKNQVDDNSCGESGTYEIEE